MIINSNSFKSFNLINISVMLTDILWEEFELSLDKRIASLTTIIFLNLTQKKPINKVNY